MSNAPNGWDYAVKFHGKRKHIELRKTFVGGPNYAQVLVVLAREGVTHTSHEALEGDRWGRSTSGYHVRMSMNGVAMMTIRDIGEMNTAITWAWHNLDEL